jgi:hypothetical protein
MAVIKDDVEKLIELRNENTFLNHLWNVFFRDFRPKGVIGSHEITFWKQNMWNMTFYPIFTFEFNSDNQLIYITDCLNPIGKSIIGIFSIGVLFLISIQNLYSFDFLRNWRLVTVIVVYISIFVMVARNIYRSNVEIQLKEILAHLGVEIKEKKSEKEWSLKNILIRLFTYPFCLFLIGLNIYLFIPNGQYILALGTFAAVGIYLYADIKMIFKNYTPNTRGNRQ